MDDFYESDKYTNINPTYHVEDSEFKSNNFINILKKNNFDFEKIKSVVDVGCGAGEILKILRNKKIFHQQTTFSGFDINENIINSANEDSGSNIKFYNVDYFKSDFYNNSDLILCADVYEHIENYIGFLKKLSKGGRFFLFNIPLDIAVRSLLSKKIINENFNKVGHIHFFNKQIAKLILEYCNYEIIDSIYAKNFLEHSKKKSLKQIIYTIPVKLMDTINENISATLFGGYSLVVLAKPKLI